MAGQPPYNKQGYGGRGGSGGGSGFVYQGLPADYLKNGYFNEKKYIHRDLLESTAREVARFLFEKKLTTNQFRRFYDHARALERKLDLFGGEFKEIEGNVAKMSPMAAAAVGRNNAPPEFIEFMDKNIALVTTTETFRKGFLEHLQAVLAYHGYFEKTRGGRR